MEFTLLISRNFEKGGSSLTEDDISRICEVPIRSTRLILAQLVKAGILTEGLNTRNGKDRIFQLARPVEMLTPVKIISSIENSDGTAVTGIGDPVFVRKYASLWACAEKSAENTLAKK